MTKQLPNSPSSRSRYSARLKNLATRRKRRPRRSARRQPYLEGLEKRHLLAAITVDTLTDTVDASDGVTSLREAILQSNSNGEDDTINLPSGTLTLSVAGSGENMGATGDLDVTETNSLTIIGSENTVIDAAGLADRVFDFHAGSQVSLSGLTIRGGVASDAGGMMASDVGDGGAIYNAGSLQIDQVTLTNNAAAGASGSGGAVMNTGVFVAANSSIVANVANRAGGGIEDASNQSVVLTNVALDNNNAGVGPAATAAPGNGGGLHVTGSASVTISGGTVSGNVAASEGGGLWNSSSGTMIVDGTQIEGNEAATGGGVFNDSGSGTPVRVFTTDLVALNDSGISGNGTVTVDQSSPMNPTITVSIDATGLVPNQPHIQHIHGRFISDLDDSGTVPGPFLGQGGSAIDSRIPSDEDDLNGDGFITVGEGLAAYGNVLLNLSDPQTTAPPEGESPLASFDLASFPTAPDGTIDFEMTYSFDLRDPNELRQFNNLLPMSLREIVLHGVNTDIDVDGDGSPDGYRVTGPAAAGQLVPVGGSLTINNSVIAENQAVGNGGGLLNESGMLTISQSTIRENVSGGDQAGTGGGGLANLAGTVHLSDTDLIANTATAGLGNGGGILNNDGGTLVVRGGNISSNEAARAGGGVENAGVASFESVRFEDNQTGINGGAFHTSGPWDATFVNSTVVSNTAGAEGGGLWNSASGTLVVAGSEVSGNIANGDDADQGGGGVFNDGGQVIIGASLIDGNTATGASGSGGGILNLGGMLTVSNTTISSNTANRAGGGIESTDASETELVDSTLRLNVAGPAGTAAPGNGGGFHISGAGNASIIGGTVAENAAAAEGGGLWNGSGVMTVEGTTFELNTVTGMADDNGGGALFNNGGTLRVTDVTVMNNSATGTRGGGGGIMNVAEGTLEVAGSTFTSNVAAGTETGDGGGGILSTDGVVTVSDSNFTNNTALGTAGSGGAILARTGELNIVGSTIEGNQASRAGGGIEIGSVKLLLVDVTLGGTSSEDGNSVAGSSANPGNGGGLHVTFDSDVIISGGLIANNAAVEGGGLWNSATGTMSVDGTTIDANVATGDAADNGGGGVFNDGGELMIINSMITNNIANGTSGSGGGILNLGGSMEVKSSTIGGNTANRAGGGIEVTANSSTTLADIILGSDGNGIVGNSVRENAAPGNGGGLHISGNGVVTIHQSSVSDNAAIEGGGLWNSPSGTLTVSDSSIINNSAVRGGGLFSEVSTTGVTTVVQSTFTDNIADGDEATDGGGGIHNLGLMSVTGSSLTGNTATGTSGSGGGVANAGTLSITASDISANTANRAGGGIETLDGSVTSLIDTDLTENVAGPGAMAAPGNGGGLHISGAGNVSIIGGNISDNQAAREGGGLWNGSGVMTVIGSVISGNIASGDGADDGGGGLFNNGGTLSIVDAIVSDNVADGTSGSGGGILNLGGIVLTNDTIFEGNIANRAGGAIEVTAGSETEIRNSTLSGNVAGPSGSAAPGNGGALHISGDGRVSFSHSYALLNRAANEGGGLWNSGSGSLQVDASTLSQNDSPQGGGLFSDSGSGITTVTNSTIAANNASDAGGGIRVEGGHVNLTSVTIAHNDAMTGGGVSVASGGSLTATNTLIAENFADNAPDASGVLTSEGWNLVGESSGASLSPEPTDRINVDAMLGMLADNGGATPTIALLEGSAALSAGNSAGLTIDQRGEARPQGNGVDIGAFESALMGDGGFNGGGETQIIIPDRLLGPLTIPGNNVPTAIIFQAEVDATITVRAIGSVSLAETVTIRNGSLQQVSMMTRGTATADIEEDGLYAIIFEPQSMDRLFVIQSNRGNNSVALSVATNIISQTDTDASGQTTPSDALRVINALAIQGEGEFAAPRPFLDVNRDGQVSPLDALAVINQLAFQQAGSNDSLAESSTRSAAIDSVMQQGLDEDDDSAIDSLANVLF
ncbi:choice-of-anchor Q domain-containing protein [Roseiconus lacunae]|uniref:choice-of-anchor Q domain-containing protein n=1 Tax=Roseiconus lacunae TaxID=2605694 RepID=UPI001E29C638|nr:choice-of-anchor Q domain-containing protein [Roseiconus lacunae]MCD0458259.1 dockerin type I domain-containing protein [Roseiconus lacunae]